MEATEKDARYNPATLEEKWAERWAADPELYASEPPPPPGQPGKPK